MSLRWKALVLLYGCKYDGAAGVARGTLLSWDEGDLHLHAAMASVPAGLPLAVMVFHFIWTSIDYLCYLSITLFIYRLFIYLYVCRSQHFQSQWWSFIVFSIWLISYIARESLFWSQLQNQMQVQSAVCCFRLLTSTFLCKENTYWLSDLVIVYCVSRGTRGELLGDSDQQFYNNFILYSLHKSST